MATEPHAPAGPETLGAGSPIENEIPTYRAISPWAVVSLVLGLLGILSFADQRFLIASALGVAVGLVGLRQITRQPEIWTGLGLARAGIALSLAFGIAAFTTGWVQSFLIRRSAQKFSTHYLVQALNQPRLDYALWYRLPPSERETTKVEEVAEQFSGGPAQGSEAFRRAAGQVYDLHERLSKDKTAKVEFVDVEQISYDGIIPTAFVLMRVRHDPGADHDKAEAHSEPSAPKGEFAGVVLKNQTLHRADGWWVDDYLYPYTPDTYVEAPKPVDDGHGHPH